MEIITLGKIGALQRMDEAAVRAFYEADKRQNPIVKRFVIEPVEEAVEARSLVGPTNPAETLVFGPVVVASTYVSKRKPDSQVYEHLLMKLKMAADYVQKPQTGIRHHNNDVWVDVNKYREETQEFRTALDGHTVKRKYEVPEVVTPEAWRLDLARKRTPDSAHDITDFLIGNSRLEENGKFIGDFKSALVDYIGLRSCTETAREVVQLGNHIFMVKAIPSTATAYTKMMDEVLGVMSQEGLRSTGHEVVRLKGIAYARVSTLKHLIDGAFARHTTSGNMRYELAHFPNF